MIDPVHSLAFSVHSNPGVYALLLGSGISRSAGIPTGWDITLDLITKLAAARAQEVNGTPEKWFVEEYGEAPDYSDLLDELSGTQTERQQSLRPYFEPNEEEREQGLKQPTAAHKAIASLVAKGFFKVIITTNFDRLMEKALEDIGVVPDVLSSVDQVHGAKPLIHMNCCVFKIHGDYMDTRIRNTPSELGEYPEEYDNFLERIFDEFGLIVCGWSADWDAALRRALFSSPSRRYTTFWATRGEPGDNAKKLIQHRDGQRISITDADSFFQGIGEGVESISKLSRPHPLSAEIAVATVKRYLSEPKFRIDLSDLISESVDGVIKETGKEAFETQGAPQPDANSVTNRLRSYEAITATLQAIAVTGGRWVGDDHFAMWERAVQQLTAMPLKSGNVLLLELRAYPGKLLLYSLGLGAVYSGRLEFLNRLFKTKVRHENNEITAAEFLARFCSITNQRMWQAFLEGMSGRHVPFSDWLYETLRQPAQHIHLSEAEYSLQFDKFEILSALAFGHQEVQKGHTYWNPVGAFVYRHENEGLVTRELTDSITSLGNESPVVQSGLVGDTPEECLASMQEFQRVVSDARRHLRIWR